MKCNIDKMRSLAEPWLSDIPHKPAAEMLGDERLAYEALLAADEIERLEETNCAMLDAIKTFCEETSWGTASWKRQPHIAALFAIAANAKETQ